MAAAVLLTGGTFHEVDSSEYGYRIAGQQAGRAALIGSGLLPAQGADALRWATWPGWLWPCRPSRRRPKRTRQNSGPLPKKAAGSSRTP